MIRQEGGATVLRDAVRSPLLPGTAVFAGDVVETAASSRVTLRFEDDSTLTAGPSSRVAVSEYAVSSGRQADRRAVLAAGRDRPGAVQQAGFGSFAVQTEDAVASARSTEWTVEILPASTAVLGIEGAVEVTGRRDGCVGHDQTRPGDRRGSGRAAPTPPVTWGAATGRADAPSRRACRALKQRSSMRMPGRWLLLALALPLVLALLRLTDAEPAPLQDLEAQTLTLRYRLRGPLEPSAPWRWS